MADTNTSAEVGATSPEESVADVPHTNGAESTETEIDVPVDDEHLAENGEGGEEALPDFDPGLMEKQPQLDSHLAVIEEQFRRGFDERFSTSNVTSQRQVWEDPVETMRANKIFREVSRGLGGEWRPVFDKLMAPFPREVMEMELGKISRSQPIIQGYKALTAWKEIAGRNYSLMQLVDALHAKEFDDIADAVIHIIDHDDLPDSKDKPSKPIQRRKSDLTPQKNPAEFDNRRLLLIAKKIGGTYEALAKELGLPDEEVSDIKESEGETYQGSFKVLWTWRENRHPQSVVSKEEEGAPSDVDLLKAALEKANLKDIADQVDSLK